MKKLILLICIISSISISSQFRDNFIKFYPNLLFPTEMLINEANSWMGVRYSWGGTTRKGVDCSAFVRNVYKKSLGISLPRTSREQFNNTKQITQSDAKSGDLVFFLNSKGIHHVGLILGDGNFIHASSSSGVRIDSLRTGYWSQKTKKFSRII